MDQNKKIYHFLDKCAKFGENQKKLIFDPTTFLYISRMNINNSLSLSPENLHFFISIPYSSVIIGATAMIRISLDSERPGQQS